jgi:aminoacyl tRNA synthase complex-interacting multifunctional protein 1
MANTTIDEKTFELLKSAFPSTSIDSTADASKVSSALYPQATYTDADKKEIDHWVLTASHVSPGVEDGVKTAERLSQLNTHLSTRTTILGTKPSVADIVVYAHIAPLVVKWTPEGRTGQQGYHHIVRHVDFVQNSDTFHLGIGATDKVAINLDDVIFKIPPVDAKAEKERKKKEKEAAAAAVAGATAGGAGAAINSAEKSKTEKVKEKVKEKVDAAKESVDAALPGASDKKKREKKEKAPKPAKETPKEKPLSPALIDLRVGHILKAIQHPNADSLYVSTIAMGDAPGTDNTSEYEGKVVRTVCSGLNGLIPLEEMQGRKIAAVCNLKPVTMRGIKSCAMVLAASPRVAEGEEDHHKGPVELVSPPASSEAGERIYFEGWEGDPEAVLNPKKKIWETMQPGFTTTDDLEVAFNAKAVPQLAESPAAASLGKLRTKQGLCTVKTLKGATVR